MNYFSRVLVCLFLATLSLPAWAGLLSQKTVVLNPDYGSASTATPPYDYFSGTGVAISHDGMTFVVAAPNYVTPTEWNDSTGSTASYRYVGGQWTNGASGYVNGPPTAVNYGTGIALSADGLTAVFGVGQSCALTTDTFPNCLPVMADIRNPIYGLGNQAVQIQDPTWQSLLSTSTFGQATGVSSDGFTIIVGAPSAGSDTSVEMNERPGEAFIFTTTDNGSTWSTTTLTNPAAASQPGYGSVVAMSADGKTAVVETPEGSAYVYKLADGIWSPAGTFDNLAPIQDGFTDGVNPMAPVPAVQPYNNASMAISADGNTVVFAGVDGVLVETFGAGDTWSGTTISNSPLGAVSVSADGTMIAAADTVNNSVDLYVLASGSWTALAPVPGPSGITAFGWAGLALSGDKETLVVTDPYTTVSGWAYSGAVYVYQSPADLSLTLTAAPASVALNQQTALNFTATNNDSQVTVYNVVVADTLPAGLAYVSANAAGGNCSASGQVVTCMLASLAPGAVWQPSITAQVATAGSYTDSAKITGNQPDPNATNNSASVTIGMLVPVASNGSVSTTMGTAVSGTLSGSNPCGCGMLVFSIVTQPTHGTVSLTNTTTGAFTYTPAAGFTGADSFTFQLANGFGTSATATESVTVAASGGPVASNGSVTTSERRPVRGRLHATGTGRLTFKIVSQPAHGTLLLLNARRGTFLYIPDFRYTGTDSFTFTASDSTGTSNTATETITVQPAAPVALPGFLMTREGAPVSGTLAAFGSGPFSYAITTQPQHGTVTLTNAATGAFTYTSAAGFRGFDEFRFDVSNAGGTSRATPEFIFVLR